MVTTFLITANPMHSQTNPKASIALPADVSNNCDAYSLLIAAIMPSNRNGKAPTIKPDIRPLAVLVLISFRKLIRLCIVPDIFSKTYARFPPTFR